MLLVPKYRELSVRRVWDYVKEIPELCSYFPDYSEKQTPEKDFLFTILTALRPDALEQLVLEARKKRSVYEQPDIEEYVEMTEHIKEEIASVFNQKSKFGSKINLI